ncbi:extracellular solute-binding protein [candidate division KSB3 bacterium]|uniref:Extracellular solute-binding protein n=1 Tax=candidate division KSB3 bacterium TaxID=2044937 RepID=A0A9D5K0H8_9BACT|nr:extracellular solute-binding protein [candidate division KSB3 bacterium]MBD3327623.1 extracellular solute-binding protein [candidate division KSB3 bacterium]
MKRIGTLSIATLLILTLGMVGSVSAFDWKKYEGETIVINFPAHLAHDKWIELIPEFEEMTGINVEVDRMQYMRMHDKQLLELGKPVGDYDVIAIVGPLWKTQYAMAGQLAPLEGYIEDPEMTFPEYDFDDFIDAYVTVQGIVCLDCKGKDIYLGGGPDTETHLYAIPASSETSIFAYRKDLFEEYDLEVPDTWDEVLELSKFFYENVDGVYGLTMRGEAGHQAGAAWLNFADPFGVKMFNDEWEPTFTSPASIEVLEFMKKMVEYGPPGIPGFDVGAADNAFLQGQAAMYFDHSRIAGLVRDPDQSTVVGKVGYAITPKKVNRLAETGGFGVAIPANSQNKEAAWFFITWMTSKDVEWRLANQGVQLTDRMSILMDPELQAKFAEYEVLTRQEPDPDWRPAIAEFPEIETQYFGVAVNQVMTGEKTPEEAMQGIVEPIKKILEEGGYYD